MRTTADNERMSLALTLELARNMSQKLETALLEDNPADAFPLRLAYAHALGLVDQLRELVGDFAR